MLYRALLSLPSPSLDYGRSRGWNQEEGINNNRFIVRQLMMFILSPSMREIIRNATFTKIEVK